MAKTKKMKPFTVTLDWLVAQEACISQREQFKKLFGKRVRVTEEVVRKHGANFDLGWLIHKLCGNTGHYQFEREMRNTVWPKYYAEKSEALHPVLFTKNNQHRKRVDWGAYDKAFKPVVKRRDKREAELAIRVLRDYRKA